MRWDWIARFTTLLKRFFQRRIRGFDDGDLWNLDTHLAILIAPRLRAFRAKTLAHPAHMTAEEWEEILDKIQWSMDMLASGQVWEMDDMDERVQEGLDLFGKYFRALWW